MTGLSAEAILLLTTALALIILTLFHHARARAGRVPARRPLPAFDVLRAALGRAAETGRAIHVSPGSGVIQAARGNTSSTAETVAGLLATERLVHEAALNGANVLVSSGDAVAHLALRGNVRQAYQRAGHAQDYDGSRIQLLAHQDATAYAAGVAALYQRERLEASQLVGSFGQEFLLLAETGQQRELPQVAGATSLTALPFMLTSTDATLIGEEVFAAEAYIASTSPPQARLMTQDVLRTVVIICILAGLIYGLVQPSLGLPPLPSL
ncbi:MAG: hypothetical protein MUD01_05270 [Chloroflexaceae bacterium]|jgi:hypothetical protein|nr:hypothetical protein [Chloroflexaceae bacterium]